MLSLMAAVLVHQKMGREPVNWRLSDTLYGMSFKRISIAVAQSVTVGVVIHRINVIKHEYANVSDPQTRFQP